MKFTGKIIISDIDFTFLDEHRQPVARNLEAVEYFKRNGGRFAIATGRVPECMGPLEPVFRELVNSPCVVCNGAYLYDFTANQRHSEILLDYDRTDEMMRRVMAEFPDVGVRISTQQGYLIVRSNNYIRSELSADGWEKLKRAGLYHEAEGGAIPHNGWFRVAFRADAGRLNQVRERFEADYAEFFAFSFAEETIYEFQDITATKGSAIARLKAHLRSLGDDSELRVWAAGDYENDLPLLAASDISACPSNAIDKVKAIAKIHLCHCNDGAIADLIERIERGEA
ncbi:MAG: HAD family phosphatase [Clostridia bacterium]|nr:HAD family phosphatase [Clostridia bacterium]